MKAKVTGVCQWQCKGKLREESNLLHQRISAKMGLPEGRGSWEEGSIEGEKEQTPGVSGEDGIPSSAV